MALSISRGNTKLGRVMSVSLPPVKSCGSGLPCYGKCYAAKLARVRPVVRAAWERNWKAVMTGRTGYFSEIREAVLKAAPELFRWHVAGDIPDFNYLGRMCDLASDVPGTLFLAFTKKYDLLLNWLYDGQSEPDNLTLVASAWPGLTVPDEVLTGFPSAWMRPCKGYAPGIPEAAAECPGNCESCRICWNMLPGESVVFDEH